MTDFAMITILITNVKREANSNEPIVFLHAPCDSMSYTGTHVFLSNITQQKQNISITFVQCWSNVETLVRRCKNVIQFM